MLGEDGSGALLRRLELSLQPSSPPADNKEVGKGAHVQCPPLQLLGQSTVRAGGREERAGKAQVLPTSGTFSFLLAVSALFAGSSTQVPQGPAALALREPVLLLCLEKGAVMSLRRTRSGVACGYWVVFVQGG